MTRSCAMGSEASIKVNVNSPNKTVSIQEAILRRVSKRL